MLRCLSTWVKREDQGFIRIRGDAQEVLAALAKRAAKSPLLNEVTKEAALHLAVHFASLEALHLWSEQNEWADALSRGQMPVELSHLPRVEQAPELWHEKKSNEGERLFSHCGILKGPTEGGGPGGRGGDRQRLVARIMRSAFEMSPVCEAAALPSWAAPVRQGDACKRDSHALLAHVVSVAFRAL